jgi:uncharacterized protein YcfL
VTLLLLFVLFLFLLVGFVAHLAVNLSLQDLAGYLFGDRVLILSLSPDNAVLVIVALVDLSNVKAVNAQVVVGE